MSNNYFDPTANPISANSLAKSGHINNLRSEIEVSFDKLPSPNLIATGATTYGVDVGTTNAYVVSMPMTAKSYTVGMRINFKASNENTGPSTLNVDGLGERAIKTIDGDDLPAGVLKTTVINTFTYNGVNFILAGVTSAVLEELTNTATTARDEAVAAKLSTDADATATAADATATAADRVQTGLDVIATAADRVQTGLDATAAAGSASDAADSAALAATFDPENYYLKTETYSDTEVDGLINNLGSQADSDQTISSLSPSGGSSGDVWYQV